MACDARFLEGVHAQAASRYQAGPRKRKSANPFSSSCSRRSPGRNTASPRAKPMKWKDRLGLLMIDAIVILVLFLFAWWFLT